jgi:hypothetical protein
MVDGDGDVLVVRAVRQLVDAEQRGPLDCVGATMAVDYPLDDVVDRGRSDAHLVADRPLVAALREVADLVLDRAR